MNTTLTSRVLAGGTVAGAILLGYASGVFGTFSTTMLSGQSCSGYGYFSGYGYGYDCTVNTGGGGSVITTTSPVVVTTPPTSSGTVTPPTPTVTPSVVLFPEFTPECSNEVTNLTDSRLTPYYGEIGVINTSNTSRKVTRAEFLKLAINAAGIDVSAETNPGYSDVPATHSLRKYIAYATRNGIVSGQNGKFRPDDLVSRAEVAKILVLGAHVDISGAEVSFADVGANSSLALYIQTAFDNCILHGRKTVDGDSTVGSRVFEPADGMTLAEAIKVLYNVTR
jgi:hypothetical protein